LRSLGKEYRIACGYGVWKKARTDFASGADWRIVAPREQHIVASGAWTADDTYTAKLSYYTTPLAVTLTFRFAGEHVLLANIEYSVDFGSPRFVSLIGEAK
jgi:hypothetical protein